MEGQFDMLIPVYFIKVLADAATIKFLHHNHPTVKLQPTPDSI